MRETGSEKGDMVKKFLYSAILSIMAMLAFASVAAAQQAGEDAPCTGASEEFGPPGTFVPDVGGCIFYTGIEIGYVLDILNRPVYDPDTGEELGIFKNLDPDLSSRDSDVTSKGFGVTYQEFCGAFPTPDVDDPLGGLTAQEYYDQLANTKERAILDPDGDGFACTFEDTAFLTGDTGASGVGGSGNAGADSGAADGSQQDKYAGEADSGQQGDQITELPDTGGPALLLAVTGLLVSSGLLGLLVAIRRRA